VDYDSYWAELGDHFEDPARLPRFRAIGRHIEARSSVLDIGCGDGDLLTYLRSEKEITSYGLEYSSSGRARARARGLDVGCCDLTSRDFSLEHDVDYIVISEVLEHIPNSEDVLLKIKSRFRKGLIITIPNVGSIVDRLRLLFGRFPHQWIFHPNEHLRFWTVTDFLFTCRQLGYGVERVEGLYTPFMPSFLKLWSWYPRLFAPHVLYVLSRADDRETSERGVER
jgi:methionine biosynthesis protein MetW